MVLSYKTLCLPSLAQVKTFRVEHIQVVNGKHDETHRMVTTKQTQSFGCFFGYGQRNANNSLLLVQYFQVKIKHLVFVSVINFDFSFVSEFSSIERKVGYKNGRFDPKYEFHPDQIQSTHSVLLLRSFMLYPNLSFSISYRIIILHFVIFIHTKSHTHTHTHIHTCTKKKCTITRAKLENIRNADISECAVY